VYRFKGSAEYSVDSKGRVAIPAKMRAALRPDAQDSFTLLRLDGALFLYPQDEWTRVEQQLDGLNAFRLEARQALRLLLQDADDAELDKQGRIMVARSHLDYAGIEDKAFILGMHNHIEVWEPSRYRTAMENVQAEAHRILEHALGGVI
jgi:MraZ protein